MNGVIWIPLLVFEQLFMNIDSKLERQTMDNRVQLGRQAKIQGGVDESTEKDREIIELKGKLAHWVVPSHSIS